MNRQFNNVVLYEGNVVMGGKNRIRVINDQPKKLTLKVDGEEIKLPDRIQQLVVESLGAISLPLEVKAEHIQRVESQNGSISVTGATVDDVHTTSGDITCGDVSGNAQSVSGDIRCSRVSGSASSVSGDIFTQSVQGSTSTVSGKKVCK